MGVPSLLLVIAGNQQRIAEGLDTRGIAQNLGWHESVNAAAIAQAVERLLGDDERRAEMSQRGRQLVDGRGAMRVAWLLGVDLAAQRRMTRLF